MEQKTTRFLRVPGHSALNGKLTELLRSTQKDTLTDEEIEASVGVSCRVGDGGYSTLNRVCDALRCHGLCWTREPGSGCIQRRSSEYIAKRSTRSVQVVRRKIRKEVRTLACANLNELNDADKRTLLTSQACMAAAMMTVDTSTVKKMEVRQSERVADASAVFALIGK